MKDVSAFHKHAASPDGLRYKCKPCRSAEARVYNEKHKAKHAAQYAAWRVNNAARAKASQAAWHARNKDHRNVEARANYAKMCAEHPASQMVDRARARAKKLGLPFDLEIGDILIPERCPVLGIPLVFRRGQKGASPNSPSLDRFDGEKGYTKDNVVVISHRANTIKNNATMFEVERVLAYMKSTPVTVGGVIAACEHGHSLPHLLDLAGGVAPRKRRTRRVTTDGQGDLFG